MAIRDLDPRQPPIRVLITLHHDSAMSVEGPMDNKALMRAILESALDIVKNYRGPQDKQLIVPPGHVSVQ